MSESDTCFWPPTRIFARVDPDSDSRSGSNARTSSDICPIDSDFRRPINSGYRRRSVGLGPGPCSLGQRSAGHARNRSPSRSDVAAADGARSDARARTWCVRLGDTPLGILIQKYLGNRMNITVYRLRRETGRSSPGVVEAPFGPPRPARFYCITELN